MLGKNLIEQLLADAASSPRLRAHWNIHRDAAAPVQRTCVALKHGTYVRPHLHPQLNKWKLLVILRGKLGVVLFNADGTVCKRLELASGGDLCAVELKPNTWHTVFPLDGDAVLLDIKEGPYDPAAPVTFAAWAPEEGSEEVVVFLDWLQTAQYGMQWALDV